MFGKLLGASLAYLPALWVTAGVAVVLVGLLPRAAALAWIVPLYAFLVGYLGQILQFPNWMNNLSPFGHIPNYRPMTSTSYHSWCSPHWPQPWHSVA